MANIMIHVDDPLETDCSIKVFLNDTQQFVKQLRNVCECNDNGEVNAVVKFAIDGFGYKLSSLKFRSDDSSIVKINGK